MIVEDGGAAKTTAASIDLNKVRASMVQDPADDRWSSFGKAIGRGAKGNGKTARAGPVRALRTHKGSGADPELWAGDVSREYRKLLMSGIVVKTVEAIARDGVNTAKVVRKKISAGEAERSRRRRFDLEFRDLRQGV